MNVRWPLHSSLTSSTPRYSWAEPIGDLNAFVIGHSALPSSSAGVVSLTRAINRLVRFSRIVTGPLKSWYSWWCFSKNVVFWISLKIEQLKRNYCILSNVISNTSGTFEMYACLTRIWYSLALLKVSQWPQVFWWEWTHRGSILHELQTREVLPVWNNFVHSNEAVGRRKTPPNSES